MFNLAALEIWFVTGSQHLYGPEVLDQVARNSADIVGGLGATPAIPVRVVQKPVQTNAESIRGLFLAANADPNCAGVIAWMHTFSPAKMWIAGLVALQKPLLHLHTQHNRDLPWGEIDMDFMNLNQAAHGDREFGYIETRLRKARKTVAGHWQDPAVHRAIGTWSRAAAASHDVHGLRIARFGDNMRQVAVTEGDKVEAEARLGFSVNGYGVSELQRRVGGVDDGAVGRLVEEYGDAYDVAPELRAGGDRHASLRDAAAIELALRGFLVEGGFGAFTDTFEDLAGLRQLPGIAVQRLMADGYGFGGEGDWKTAAMVRLMKTMASGLPGGTSFMEDYTYHLDPRNPLVLGAHMLEVCPSIAAGRPRCEIHPLGIGGKDDPVRLVFTADAGPAVVVALSDMRDRFRLVANVVENVALPEPMPKLPVGRAVWKPAPDFRTSATAWLTAGAAHHTVMSTQVGVEVFRDFAAMSGVELLVIDADTTTEGFAREIRWNAAYWRLAQGI